MSVIAGALLVILGVALWLAAGLVPVLRMVASSNGTTPNDTADLTLYLTWMGVIRLRERAIGRVKGARITRSAEGPAAEEVLLATDEGWQTFTLPKMKQQLSPAQLSRIIDRYAKVGGPPALSLPLKDRMAMMVTFALLFPLGTVSFLAGSLMVINGF
jgi:hypothetical protein